MYSPTLTNLETLVLKITSARSCEICNASHKNRLLNYCNDCKEQYKSGYTKKCIKYNSMHRYLNPNKKCNACCSGQCVSCNSKIDPKYKKCYKCNLIKK